MSRPPYPHRLPYRDGLIGLCKCGAACSTAALTAPVSDGREAWYEVGRDCPAALREALAEAEHTANAAHDQLSDIAALARGEMEPDVRSGGAPVLGEAWEAVKVLRARAERAEAERDAARKMLAECYRLSGADPDGDTWEHLWQTALDEVRLLRKQYDEMRRELAEATDPDNRLRAMLEWRGVVTPCAVCSGSGRRGYANTSTWRRGIGGQMLTDDVCDSCWGSGDAERPGANLRAVHSLGASIHKAVAAALEAKARELEAAADTQDAYAEGPDDAVRVATLRRAASIVRGA